MGNKMCDQRPVAVGRYHVRAFTTGMYLAGRLAGGKMVFIVKEGKKQEASGFLPQPLSPEAAGSLPRHGDMAATFPFGGSAGSTSPRDT